MVAGYGWGDDQFACLVSLWNKESGWRVNAYNASSGAYGIPQSLPGSKMASAGSDWRSLSSPLPASKASAAASFYIWRRKAAVSG